MIRFTAILIAVFATVGLGSAGATPQAPSGATVGPAFAGSGDRLLPPITVSVPSTLRWTSNGPLFQIFSTDALGGAVNSAGRSGATLLNVGTHRLEVNAYAGWTIRIVPGVERPQPLGGGLVGFRGNGSRELPPFTTRRGTNLIWTNSGAVFQIDSGAFTLSIKSQGKRGKRYMSVGIHEFDVLASGSWTIGWKP
ncbi:MAG: hypothetical protein QOF45_1438 [Gaiellaceae bacterium]|jgi:hypothetical protein|nr:hypothetical protein [Gaiellaceae bacterium]